MTVPMTILTLVVIPIVVYFGVAALVALPRLARRPRHRPGQAWDYPPLWWTANPEGAALPDEASQRTGDRGGARGSW